MAITWVKIFERSYYTLQVPNRQKIDIIHAFTSQLIAIELSKVGGWDYSFVGHLAPFTYIPSAGAERVYSKWKRLRIGKQLLNLESQDLLGNLEFVPRLWIPDITIRVWEGQDFKEDFSGDLFHRIKSDTTTIESKIDALTELIGG